MQGRLSRLLALITGSYSQTSPKGCDRCRQVRAGTDGEAACVLEGILDRAWGVYVSALPCTIRSAPCEGPTIAEGAGAAMGTRCRPVFPK
jgi:hypothetical protein